MSPVCWLLSSLVQLRRAHNAYRLLQIPDLTGVKVWRREGDVPEGHCPENLLVRRCLGYRTPALSSSGRSSEPGRSTTPTG